MEWYGRSFLASIGGWRKAAKFQLLTGPETEASLLALIPHMLLISAAASERLSLDGLERRLSGPESSVTSRSKAVVGAW